MGERAFISREVSHGAHPISTYMPLHKESEGHLKQIADFAREIILKYPPEPGPATTHGAPVIAGIASIVGTWKVPTDNLPVHRSRTRTYVEHNISGAESVTETKHEDGITPVEDVEIYLCKAEDAAVIVGQISVYAGLNGLDPDKFHSTWPSTRKQALVIRGMMDAIASSRKVDTARTDSSGEYQFTSVPKGQYVLYASVQTKKYVLYWLSKLIDISTKTVVSQDFNFADAFTAWKIDETPQKVSPR